MPPDWVRLFVILVGIKLNFSILMIYVLKESMARKDLVSSEDLSEE